MRIYLWKNNPIDKQTQKIKTDKNVESKYLLNRK